MPPESDGRNSYVIGVDFGTLSGRAVVVRVSDGVELGSATYEYPHAVIERNLPDSATRLPPDWALQVPSDYLDVLRNAVPAHSRRPGSTQRRSSASGPTSPPAP
jgi:L-ribulokinase